MAPPATKPTASDSLQESPELRETTTPPPADPPTPQPLDIRLESVEKEVLYLRDAVTQILRNQIFGVSRDGGSTPSGFSTPTPAMPLQTVNPQPLAGQNREIFSGPQPKLQMRLKETRLRPPMFEQPHFQASTSSEPLRFQTTSLDPLRFPASVSEPPGFQTGFQTSFPTTPPLPPVLHPSQLPPQLPSPRPRADPAPRRLVDFPAYEGGNADDWLFRLEQCFLSNQTPEDEKLDKAISCLTGPAVTWWRCSREREQIYALGDFQERFRVRFRQSRGSSAIDHLFNIRQTGSVEEYRERFEELTVD